MRQPPAIDPEAFIRASLRLARVPDLPEIRLYTAHQASGLSRLVGGAPYWAYPWAGGAALARYIAERPETVAGKRLLDLGTGSGLVAIVAAKAGANPVTAFDVDPFAIAAAKLNAEENGIAIAITMADIIDGPPPDVDIVAVGDLFYDEALARRVIPFLDRCLAAGITVLIGDPRRAYLPYGRLALLAEYTVTDVGEPAIGNTNASAVFALQAET